MKLEKLGKLAKNLDSKRIPLNSIERSQKSENGKYPYIGANNIVGYINEYIFDEKILCLAEDGGSWGFNEICANIYNEKCWVNNHAHVLTENGKASLEYLRYFLNYENLNKYITGTTRGKLTKTALENIEIPIPEKLEDQIRIATLLSKVETLIKQRKESIALLDEFLKSTFLKMFGDPVRNEKGWELRTIEQLVKKQKYSLKRGPFGGALKKDIFVQSGYLVYEQFHALNNDFSFERYFIDEEKFQELKAFEVFPGDIIISCSGVYLGKLAIVPPNAKRGIINQALLKITLNNAIIDSNFFVKLFSHNSFKNKFYGNSIGSGIPNFPPMDEFKKFKFIYPSIELQHKFSKIVEKTEALKNQYQNSLQELENLFSSLSQKAFKGELDLSKMEVFFEEQYSSTENDRKVPKPLDLENIKVNVKSHKFYGGGVGVISPQWLANQITKKYTDKHFSFEMLLNFLKKEKVIDQVKYFSSEEIKANPKYDELEDLKVFLETAIVNVEMDVKQKEKRNPWLQLSQYFYNAKKENINLELTKEDFDLIKNKTAEERSGIYFKIVPNETN